MRPAPTSSSARWPSATPAASSVAPTASRSSAGTSERSTVSSIPPACSASARSRSSSPAISLTRSRVRRWRGGASSALALAVLLVGGDHPLHHLLTGPPLAPAGAHGDAPDCVADGADCDQTPTLT